MVNHIRQHIPNSVDIGDPKEVDFTTTEELLNIEWVKGFKDNYPDFYMWGISKELLMATYDSGRKWWAVGYLSRPELVQLPKILSYKNGDDSLAVFQE